MATALEICARNTAGAKARDEAARAQIRADFPTAVRIVAELAADQSFPGHPPFKPRVIWMEENGKRWSR